MNESAPQSEPTAGTALRRMALTTPADELGFAPDDEFPHVYGVLTDWDVGEVVATVMSLRDGTASLYTSSTFGILGGSEEPSLRQAAARYVEVAQGFADAAEPVTDFPYPPPDRVHYHLLTYDGVRRAVGHLTALEDGSDPTLPLFAAAQDVLTELRLMAEKKEAEGGTARNGR